MPMKVPDLDDRTYDDLMTEALASIPAVYPQWTDHNPSNPGITLVELLAWLSEMLIYRTNLVPEKTQDVFLKLIRGPEWKRPADQDIDTAIRETVAVVRERFRAISEDDYDYLTLHRWNAVRGVGVDGVARVRCLAEQFVDGQDKLLDAPGYITLLVVPDSPLFRGVSPVYWVDPSVAVTDALKVFFDDRKLLTTRLRVRGPSGVRVKLGATLYLKDDARTNIGADVRNALLRYFHPVEGGPDGRGWPWGQAVYPSDVYAVLDEVSGIDYVENVMVVFDRSLQEQALRTLEGDAVKLFPHELVRLEPGGITFTLMERRGDTWVVKSA